MTKVKLSKKDIEEFKKRLEEMRGQLTKTIQESTDEVKSGSEESSGYSQHQADEGTDNFDRTISLEVSSSEYGILKQIDRALEKIEEETYGICDISGDAIPKARLEAVPYANMTVQAQEQLEKGLI